MHEYPIEGVQDGTLRAEKDGLYWKIDASCTRDWDHPIRLLAETDGVRVNLGVPQPEGKKLRLQCRLSARSCPLSDGTRVRTDPQGAYFVLADIGPYLRKGESDVDFCLEMAEKVGVACVPGTSFFNENVNNIVRVHFAKKDETLYEALDRLSHLKEKMR